MTVPLVPDAARISRDPQILNALYRSLGNALSHWQHVETALYALLHRLLCTDNDATSTVFFHIQSFETKAQLVDKLCALRLTNDCYKDFWVPLRKEITHGQDFRNGMAHFEVNHIYADQFDYKDSRFPVALTPHHLDRKWKRGTTVKAIYVEMLEANATESTILAKKIIQFGYQNVPAWQLQVKSLPPSLQRILEIIRNEASSATPPQQPQP